MYRSLEIKGCQSKYYLIVIRHLWSVVLTVENLFLENLKQNVSSVIILFPCHKMGKNTHICK